MRPRQLWAFGIVLLSGVLLFLSLAAQESARSPAFTPANLTLRATASSASAESLRDPETRAWELFAAQRVALNRTPPLYDTEPPSRLEIPVVEVRVARAEGKLLVHLSWRDPSGDIASLAAPPDTPPEKRQRKELTAATARFFDAVAVMFPVASTGGLFPPSLQMGDSGGPVTIYYWNASRGAMRMEAHGRGTTRRTGQSFLARGVYGAGRWRVTLELPDLPAGVPLSFAVWNGGQQDRDGRKYFSVWHWLE